MEIDLTDLECTRVAETTFRCVAEQASTPGWFYPVVIACFVIALAILVLTIINMRKGRTERNRRADDQPVRVQLEHRKVEPPKEELP